MGLVAWYPLNKDFRNLGDNAYDIDIQNINYLIKDLSFNDTNTGTRVVVTGMDFSGGFEQEIYGKLGTFTQEYSRITSSSNDSALFLNGTTLFYKVVDTNGESSPRASYNVSSIIGDNQIHSFKTSYNLTNEVLYVDGVQVSSVSRTCAPSQTNFIISSQEGVFKANFIYKKIVVKTYADGKTYVFQPDKYGNWSSIGDSCTMNVEGSWVAVAENSVTNNGVTWDNNGKIGKTAKFSGGGRLTINNNLLKTTTYSVSFWVRLVATNTTQTIMCCRNDIGYGFSIFIIGEKLRIDASITNASGQWVTDYEFSAGEWVHITVTNNNGKISLYVNGALFQEHTITSGLTKIGEITSIGYSQYNGEASDNYLNGCLNDLRVYDHCLSKAEIKDVYRTKILHYNFTPMATNNNRDLDYVFDISGFENHGTKFVWEGVEKPFPKYTTNSKIGSYATEWDKTKSQRIALPLEVNLPEEITISLWGYKDDWNTSSAERLMGRCTMGTGWCIGDYGSENTLFACATKNRSTGVGNGTSPATGFKELSSGWHLFNMTFNGYDLTYYVDGELFSTRHWDSLQSIIYISTYMPLIGGHNHTECHFNGIIDDVRIYATALPAADIKQLYEARQRIDDEGNFYCNEINEEVREVTYLNASGTQWIHTGIDSISKKIKIEIKFSLNSSKTFQNLFCCRTNTLDTKTLFVTGLTGFRNDQNSEQRNVSADLSLNTPYIIISSQTELKLNGNVITAYPENSGEDIVSKLTLLDSYDVNSGEMSNDYLFDGKIYYCKIWDNNEIIRDFIPAISTETGHIGEPCLFDMVTNRYFYNQGTGSFTTNLTTSTEKIKITDKGILNCRYLIEGNNTVKFLQDENIIKVKQIKEN